jgi:dipeptidyl aminopeptidase/acylaminoacyl peptidase
MLVFLVVGLLGTAPLVHAQEAEQTARQSKQAEREAMYYRYLEFASYVKGGSIQPHWMADGSSFWYAEGAPANTVIWKVDPRANTKTPLFDTARLAQALTKVLGHEPPYKGLPFDKFSFVDAHDPLLQGLKPRSSSALDVAAEAATHNEKAVKFAVEGKEFVLQLDTYAITRAPALSEEEKKRLVPRVVRKSFPRTASDVVEVLSPDGRWFAGLKEHNLWLRSTYDGRTVQLTTDGVKDYEWDRWGSLYPWAQWSPDSFKLAVKKVDYRKVPKIPVVHWLKPREEVEWVRHSRAGEPIHRSELYIVDILSKRQVRVDIGEEPDQFIYILEWRPDGSEFFFLRTDRLWKTLDLMAADPITGSTRVVVTETQKTFLRPSRRRLTLLEDGERFIWMSERDGWDHLYLYTIDGNLVRRLTEGAFPVMRVEAVDLKAEYVYFTAHGEPQRPYDTHLYRVNLEGKGFTRLTEATGQHAIQFAPSKEFFLDKHSSVARPPVVELRSADGTLLQTLSKANIEALKEELKWKPPEEFVVKAADGETDLYGVLYKPYDFDPNRKYPVIDHIYAGPQTTWVPRTFAIERRTLILKLAQPLAQLGFIVFIVDGRGTPGRGKEFQDVIYGNFGRNEIPDHVATLKQLAAERPYIDLGRAGIFGGSWGGYMTIRAMVFAPDVYHVGVASAPAADLYFAALAVEPYLGLRQENKEAYEYGSSLRLAGNLKGKLLLICNTLDVNTPFSATMKIVEALIRAGKPYDLIVLPEQNHWPSGTSHTYWREAMRRYFQEHLQSQEFCEGDISSPRKLVEKCR